VLTSNENLPLGRYTILLGPDRYAVGLYRVTGDPGPASRYEFVCMNDLDSPASSLVLVRIDSSSPPR
jgi:hypothetical protein